MSSPQIEIDSETARIRAVLVNSGLHSFSEADAKLASASLALYLSKEAAETAAGQAAFLTAVLTGTRCFGSVSVHGSVEQALLFSLPIPAASLAAAAAFFGARLNKSGSAARNIHFGSGMETAGWSVQAFWNGWTAGVAPAKQKISLGRSDCSLAGVAAGALAVGQAFLAEQGDLRAGKMEQSLSLWRSDANDEAATDPGPLVKELYLPTNLWLVGLGNLGQAYLWSLTLMPYPEPQNVLLVLQDDQRVGKENWGTSVLVKRGHYGQLKTRVAEDWALQRGFQVRRIDRRLDAQLMRSALEPPLLLAGLDRMPARRLLGGRGFEYVIDAGLGATVAEYRKFRVNVFDSSGDPAVHFQGVEDQTLQIAHELLQLPAYRQLAEGRSDGGCGAAMLAESSVAVPFVSAVVGALALTQAIRIASGYPHHVATAGEVGDLRTVRSALGAAPGRLALGTVLAATG